MRIYFVIFVFFIIGCSSDSSDFPPPKVEQVYRHKTTKETIIISAVGRGEEVKDKADQMDFVMKGKIISGKNAEPAVIIYDTENADKKCIVYPKYKKDIFVEWHIITVEELAQNYVLEAENAEETPEDSLENLK